MKRSCSRHLNYTDYSLNIALSEDPILHLELRFAVYIASYTENVIRNSEIVHSEKELEEGFWYIPSKS